MARKLTFLIEDRSFEVAIFKLDRDKLYGSQEVVAVDPGEKPLRKGYLDEWGSVVISATGMGYLDGEGHWRSKADLVAVDAFGQPLETTPSSFDAPIVLSETATIDRYCAHEIVSVYVLRGFELEEFAAILNRSSELFCFPFAYRAGYETKTAFLNPVDERIFMAIGVETKLDYLKKPQKIEIDDDDEDELDFGMM